MLLIKGMLEALNVTYLAAGLIKRVRRLADTTQRRVPNIDPSMHGSGLLASGIFNG